jgi:Ca-activated chloride channel family protein
MSDKKPKPQIEIIPERAAVQNDATTEMHVLVRVVPAAVEVSKARPKLNLGLVLDRSGSMAGEKIESAKAAAIYAVHQLQGDDRVAVTIYDDEVETIVPSTPVSDKSAIVRRLQSVEARNMTALHAAWVEGGVQVSSHLEAGRLNRVLLLTDGLANVGETNADRIASDVKGLATRGVSTSTLGVGLDYNEDLLEGMARAGDGNYYFIEGAADLERIFTSELHGLMATTGRKVSLGFEPQSGAEVLDVLNDLDTTKFGRVMAPNLVSGAPLEIVVKLKIPARQSESDVCFFRLAYDGENGERVVMREVLTLPSVSSNAWQEMAQSARVLEQVAHKEASRMRRQATEAMERGDIAGAQSHLSSHAAYVACAAPAAAWLQDELSEVGELQKDLQEGRVARALKLGKFSTYRKSRSR